MKTATIITALVALCIQTASAQKIYSTDRQYQADVKVYVVDHEYQADLIVYLSRIHIAEPTSLRRMSYSGFCLKK